MLLGGRSAEGALACTPTHAPPPAAAIPADEVNAVVLDLGSYQCRAGYAGDDAPKAVFSSVRRLAAHRAAKRRPRLIPRASAARQRAGRAAHEHARRGRGEGCMRTVARPRHASRPPAPTLPPPHRAPSVGRHVIRGQRRSKRRQRRRGQRAGPGHGGRGASVSAAKHAGAAAHTCAAANAGVAARAAPAAHACAAGHACVTACVAYAQGGLRAAFAGACRCITRPHQLCVRTWHPSIAPLAMPPNHKPFRSQIPTGKTT